MNAQTHYRIDTPCGFEIWVIPLPNKTMRIRVFFGAPEISLAELNERLSLDGARILGEKLIEVCNEVKGL